MITEALLNLFGGIADWFLGLFGTAAPPAWITDTAAGILGFITAGAGLGVWIPWSTFGIVALVVLFVWTSGFWLKVFRWLLGLIPTMGGS